MTEPQKPETQEEQTPQLTPTEQKAMSMGWRPRDAWHGPEEEFIDAAEFIRRQPLFEKIEHTTKKLRNVENALQQLTAHHAKVREIEYQRALTALRHEKREALKEGNTEQALILEDQIEEMAAAHQQAMAVTPQYVPQQESGPTPEFKHWVQYNEWYLNDADMRDFADTVAMKYLTDKQRQGLQPMQEEVFAHVEKRVKQAYAEKFENPNRQRPGMVSSGDRQTQPRKEAFKLTEMEEEIARNFERNGVMTREKYIEELKALQAKGER